MNGTLAPPPLAPQSPARETCRGDVRRRKLFRLLFVFDVGIAIVLALVFGVGLLDAVSEGHVDREDLLLWPPLIGGIAAVLGGAWWLRSRQMLRAANGMLLIMAVPGVLAGILLLVLLAELSRPGAFR